MSTFDRGGRIEGLEPRRMLSITPLTSSSILSHLTSTPTLSASTVPGNGDVNPYGVTFVPSDFAGGGTISGGDVLVSNFNNSSNLQGTGTTIVSVDSSGHQSIFYQGPSGLGLTTALSVLRRGFVIVGNVPAPGGTAVTPPGSLLILNRYGKVALTLRNAKYLDGPWDSTVVDHGSEAHVFVSNVLNGTVTRIDLSLPKHGNDVVVLGMTRIGSKYLFRTDPAALVVGPTGLALDAATDTLYVASTGDNEVFALSTPITADNRRGHGTLVYQDDAHLRGPLALAIAPNGDLIAANGDAVNADATNMQNSELVEFTTGGKFVDEFQINPTAGGAFGVAIEQNGSDTSLAAVNDILNTLEVWTFEL
jgi:hypothetical protein